MQKQTPPATSVINLPRFVEAECTWRSNCRSTRWSQILAENRDFCLPHLHSTAPLEGSLSENCNDKVWYGTLWLPDCEKKLEDYVYSFRQISRTWQTDGRTPHDGIGRASIALRGKNRRATTIIQQYGDWYIGRWWVGCCIWYNEERPGRAAAPLSPVLVVPNVHPLTVSVQTSYYSMWHYNYLALYRVNCRIAINCCFNRSSSLVS